jgi:type VI protein secretion system component VasK
MALAVLAMMVAMFVAIFVVLGSLPGQIAKKRGHPNAKAIQIGGWATLLLAVVGWPFVLMWAMSEPSAELDPEEKNSNDQDLNQRVSELSQRLATLESKLEEV